MAPLAKREVAHTVEAIYAALVENNQPWDGIRISMSDMGQECDRRIWSKFRWVHDPEVFDGEKLRMFEAGKRAERRMLEDLGVAGINVDARDPRTGQQHAVLLAGGHLKGKIDGKGKGFPEAPVALHVVECKSMNAKAFAAVRKGPIKDTKPEHYVIVQLYMHGFGLQRTAYLVENRDDCTLHMERIPADPVFAMNTVARAERIVTSDKPPRRLHENPDAKGAWQCRSCPAAGNCHFGEWARRNCRTCIHATAVLDDLGTWRCERYERELSIDEQRAGCGAHLYLPGLVPGEQVNANRREEWIEYRLRDGSVWRDEAMPPTEAAEPAPTEDERREAIRAAVEDDEVRF